MVRIRLRRVGLKHQPSYRIIAADKEAPRDGRFLEILGFYNPRTEPSTLDLKEDRLFDWMNKGAQPSESVVKLLNSVGAMDRFARFKAGEPMETLLAESKAVFEKRGSGLKTRAEEKK
jgi:small subunit ribosomal protein S16